MRPWLPTAALCGFVRGKAEGKTAEVPARAIRLPGSLRGPPPPMLSNGTPPWESLCEPLAGAQCLSALAGVHWQRRPGPRCQRALFPLPWPSPLVLSCVAFLPGRKPSTCGTLVVARWTAGLLVAQVCPLTCSLMLRVASLPKVCPRNSSEVGPVQEGRLHSTTPTHTPENLVSVHWLTAAPCCSGPTDLSAPRQGAVCRVLILAALFTVDPNWGGCWPSAGD